MSKKKIKHKKKNNENLQNTLIKERYKYLIAEIQKLNENVYKNVNFFQVLISSIIGGIVVLLISWKEIYLSKDITKTLLRGLEGLIILVTLFTTISIIVGIMSWFDYRKEEAELLNKIINSNFRDFPKLKNFYRWGETYVILFMILSLTMAIIYIEIKIIPLL